MDVSKLLLILLGSRPAIHTDTKFVLSVGDLSLLTSRSPLEISHTPLLDCLSASGANGLLDCGEESDCMRLLMALASASSSRACLSIDASSDGETISKQLNEAMTELHTNQGIRMRLVHFEQVKREEEADDGRTPFSVYVDALKDEVAYLEKIDKALLCEIIRLSCSQREAETGSGVDVDDLLIGVIYLGPLVSSAPRTSSPADPSPICLAKARYLIQSLGGTEALREMSEVSSRKPKAKRPAPQSHSHLAAPAAASQDPDASHKALLSDLHKKAGYNDTRKGASWAGRRWIPGVLPRDVFGPYSDPWPNPGEVRGDAVRSFDELSAARGILGRFKVQELVNLLERRNICDY
jgi:hypothetical protein